MTITDIIIDTQAFLNFYGIGAVAVGSAFAGYETVTFEWRGKPVRHQRAVGVLVASLLWPATLVKMLWPIKKQTNSPQARSKKYSL